MPPPDLAERLKAFRSLGGNCEFGFVQRYGGVDPSGLLRFSFTPIADLIRGLDTDFAAYGAPGDLELQLNVSGTYYCHSRSSNIWLSTEQEFGSIEPTVLLDRQYGRIAHLKRRMLEDLASGSKIFVRKADRGETPEALGRLARAIGRHGPSPLLLVSEGGEAWRPGAELRRLGDRVYAGAVRRFAPTETSWSVDLEPWLILCDRAYATHHRLPEIDMASVPSVSAIPLRAGLRQHRGRPLASGLIAFTRAVDPAAFDPAEAYVFSSWVWIPTRCAASRIFAVIGQQRLGWRDADLDARGRWQRVWAAGRFGRGAEPEPVGLGMFGSEGDRFWSCGAKVHEGVVPEDTAPPNIVPEPTGLRWLTSAISKIK